jgi:RNA polymerase sigma-70 factor (ECF subfamily)
MPGRRPASTEIPADAEERLVAAAQRDPARFADLYEIHFERIYAFIARRVRDRDTAEDLTSEVFQKALANLRNFEWRGAPFAAWLMRIANNLVADQTKRTAREAGNTEMVVEPSVTEPSVETTLEEIEDQARLFRLVDRLPADQRRVIFQRFVEQRSIREIAQELGRSEGAIKQLQFRALENLRAQMEGANA